MNKDEEVFIHKSSIIDAGVRIGSGTKIWHFSHIMSGAMIGSNCVVGQNVFIGENVSIGNDVKVQNNVSLYSGVYCEDEVFIGPSVVFTNVLNPRATVNRKSSFQSTHLGRGATIGANATIICGIKIGEYAFVGAGSVVLTDLPPYCLVAGNPSKPKGWMSRSGARLNFDQFGIAKCPIDNNYYRLEHNHVHYIGDQL